MARQARIVLPGFPHHITQRGNRRQQTFFDREDYALYRDLMIAACAAQRVVCWAWCLMPNHIHLVLQPPDVGALARALSEAHQRYTRRINAREGWTGYLWQGRFASCAMDEGHALAAVRYVELNPVKAQLVRRAEDWPWSSAGYHVRGEVDGLTAAVEYLSRVPDWRHYLGQDLDAAEQTRIGYFTQTGYPLGAPDWLAAQEASTGQSLTPPRRGRPRRDAKG
jgi:putative transposase